MPIKKKKVKKRRLRNPKEKKRIAKRDRDIKSLFARFPKGTKLTDLALHEDLHKDMTTGHRFTTIRKGLK